MKETQELIDAVVRSSDKLDNLLDDRKAGTEVPLDSYLVAFMQLAPVILEGVRGSKACQEELRSVMADVEQAKILGASIGEAAFAIYNDFKNPEA